MPTRFAAAGIRVLKSETCCGRKCGSPGLTDQLRMKREAKAGRASSEQTANYESEAAKERSFFAVNLTGGRAKPKAVATPTRNPTPIHSPRSKATNGKAKNPVEMGKWKAASAENRESRAENPETNKNKQNKKKKTKRKSKIYEKLPNVTFHPLIVDQKRPTSPATQAPMHPPTDSPMSAWSPRRECEREPREESEECRVTNRKTPFFHCPGLMRLQQMRGLPAVHHFCFFPLTDTHTHQPTHQHTRHSTSWKRTLAQWRSARTLAHISCGFRQFTTKCQEWRKASRGTAATLYWYVLAPSCSHSLPSDVLLLCLPKHPSSAEMLSCSPGFSRFFLHFFLFAWRNPELVGCRIISSKVRTSSDERALQLGYI